MKNSYTEKAMNDFSESALQAERKMEEGQAIEALACLDRALNFADSDFKRSYVQGERGWILQNLAQFTEAVEAFKLGLQYAERCTWQEHQENYHTRLAKLYCHLGRFSEAQPHFQFLLDAFQTPGMEERRIAECQNFGMALLEQGRYAEALQVFTEVRDFFVRSGTPMEQALSHMQLAQVYSYLGMSAPGKNEMKMAEELLGEQPLAELRPYWKLLKARFEMLQGHMAAAFRLFEEASEGFESVQDLNGQVEVMLSLSAPLLELGLIREAQQLLDRMGEWRELQSYPALQHGVRLRRLALAAFSGRDIAQDIELVRREHANVGRVEDWMLFWMHMSLVARRLGQNGQMKEFLRKARDIADRIYQDLNAEQRRSFLRRPDMARLWRLTEAGNGKAPKVEASPIAPSPSTADAGSFAPPRRRE